MANKKYVALGHYEVMHNPNLRKKVVQHFDVEEVIPTTALVKDSEGKVVKVNSVQTRKSSERVKDLKVADFCLENLQAIGADAMLKFSTISGDIDKSLANIDALMDNIGQIESAAENNINNTNISE